MDIDSDTMVPTASAQVATPTVTQAPMMPTTVPISVSPGEKTKKFSGLNFKRWQQKMLFYLTTLNLARFLTEEAPKLKEDGRDIQFISVVDAWKHSDFMCRNYVMNALTDSLYNVYTDKKTAKELWESLDRKYKTEDAGAKKFIVGQFLDYKMVDSKTVVSQVQELQVILHESHTEGMMLSETFQVAAIIEKLPPAWKDFKNYLKHKRKEMSIEDLVIRLRIEEDNKGSERKMSHNPNEAKANFVEHGQGSKFNKGNNKGKGTKLGPKGGVFKKQKFIGKSNPNGTCSVCDKPGHHAPQCRKRVKIGNPPKANLVEGDDIIVVVVSQANMVTNSKNWVVDSGATRHIYANKDAFTSYTPIGDDEKVVYLGDSHTA